MTWESNPNFTQLPAISVGDIVHLRQLDGFSYLVKAIVSSVSPEKIEATVEAVFDGQGQGLVTAGGSIDLIGKSVAFGPQVVHKVIKYASHG